MQRLRRQFTAAKGLAAQAMRAAAVSAGLLLAAYAHGADDTPSDWLARTQQALTTLNYAGVFVHEHSGETETLRVIHRVGADGGVSERLRSMDGSGREFIRKGSILTAYLPDERTVLVEKSTDVGLLGGLPLIDANSNSQYEVKELARTRVSDRAARVIAVTPLDKLRYGYRVWIDEATAMPLKSQLLNGRGDVLEQIVFTELSVKVKIADNELEPAVDARNYRWVQQDTGSADTHGLGLAISWQASTLPAGFRMTTSTRQVLPSGPVEHLVFSDGLASVSVFVEIGHDAATTGAVNDAVATLGSSTAYSTVVQGYRITAVGEVPSDTVRAIAQSIRSAGPAASVSASISGMGVPSNTSSRGGSLLDASQTRSSIFDNSLPSNSLSGMGIPRSPDGMPGGPGGTGLGGFGGGPGAGPGGPPGGAPPGGFGGGGFGGGTGGGAAGPRR